jgi:hypothetical protein
VLAAGSVHPPLSGRGRGAAGNDPGGRGAHESHILESCAAAPAITGLARTTPAPARAQPAGHLPAAAAGGRRCATRRAHGSSNDYVQVIRRNDEELGRLRAIRGDQSCR